MLLTFTVKSAILLNERKKGCSRLKLVCGCEVVEEIIPLDDVGHTTYGLRILTTDGTVWEQRDVDTCKEAVQAFAVSLHGEYIDEEQLRYLMQDFLIKQYIR
jgi:hypothetical protein